MHSERKPTLHLAATAPLNCLERPASLSASQNAHASLSTTRDFLDLSKQRQNSVIYRWMVRNKHAQLLQIDAIDSGHEVPFPSLLALCKSLLFSWQSRENFSHFGCDLVEAINKKNTPDVLLPQLSASQGVNRKHVVRAVDHLVTQMYGVGAPDLCDTTSTAEVFEQ
ncbi:hypothetical protein KC359_g136 [Hortaea werneckii]|nr:hypothetical protein KC359_g136 [Hortaea werneckii]